MTKEDKQQLGQEAESVLDFKDAKEHDDWSSEP